MKTANLESVQYQLTLKSYQEWLQTLNYSPSVVKNYPNYIRELLEYVEQQNSTTLPEITTAVVEKFMEHLQTRQNHTQQAGGLSANTINAYINGISRFASYLRLTGKSNLHISLTRLKAPNYNRSILTQAEVKLLFEAYEPNFNPVTHRNRALLSVLYAAGLRRNELVSLNIEDVSFYNKTMHVKHGKGGKQRLIPIVEPYMSYIKEYVKNCRDIFEGIANQSSKALFIDIDGKRITGDYLEKLIKKLIRESNINSLQEKSITPHSFRHSIATHLLQNGMNIEAIAQFLGHASLDSTMIYTHIVEQLKYQDHE